MEQTDYLVGRLYEVENAITNLEYMLSNEDSKFYGDAFMKNHLSTLLFESAAIRRKLAEVRNV